MWELGSSGYPWSPVVALKTKITPLFHARLPEIKTDLEIALSLDSTPGLSLSPASFETFSKLTKIILYAKWGGRGCSGNEDGGGGDGVGIGDLEYGGSGIRGGGFVYAAGSIGIISVGVGGGGLGCGGGVGSDGGGEGGSGSKVYWELGFLLFS